MSNSWEYANHVQRVQKHGGPAAYDRALREVGYNAGFVDGKAEGQRNSMLYMLPFVVGCCYLAYDKWPVIWRKIRDKFHLISRDEVKKVEQELKLEKVRVELTCPCCGDTFYGIDEIIEFIGFDKAENGNLVPQRVCKRCRKKLKEKNEKEEYSNE